MVVCVLLGVVRHDLPDTNVGQRGRLEQIQKWQFVECRYCTDIMNLIYFGCLF